MKKSKTNQKIKFNYDLLPLLFLIFVVPFIIRFTMVDTGLEDYTYIPYEMAKHGDFFLYFRSRVIVGVALVMLVVLGDIFIIRQQGKCPAKIWIFAAVYAVLAIASTLTSAYKTDCFTGMMEQYESVFVLLSYVVIAFYASVVVRDDKDVDVILNSLVGITLLQGIVGLLQIFNLDPLNMDWIRRLVIPAESGLDISQMYVRFEWSEYQKVYGTLYNSNYAGVFFSMMLPIAVVVLIRAKGKKKIYPAVTLAVGVVSLLGTGSKSAILATGIIGISVLIVLAYTYKTGVKYSLIAVCGIVCVAAIYCSVTGLNLVTYIQNAFEAQNEEYLLEDIVVHDDGVEVIFAGEKFLYSIDDENLPTDDMQGLSVDCYSKDGIDYLMLEYRDIVWRFTDATPDGTYTYVTLWGKPDEIVKADTWIFGKAESLFTNRGYIWGRTLPLLKNYIFLGSGPDTFVHVFPQNDYVERSALGYGFFTEILIKPHSMYLQIAVQTGVLSLVCILALIGHCLVSCIKTIQTDRADTKRGILAMVIIMALGIYLVNGITNDSTVTIAPFFWMLLGMGLDINKCNKGGSKK